MANTYYTIIKGTVSLICSFPCYRGIFYSVFPESRTELGQFDAMEMNNQLIAFRLIGNQFATDTHSNKKTGLLG